MRARDNPFCAKRIDGLSYRSNKTNLEALLTKLEAMDHCAAITGPKGSGKTTLLRELKIRLENKGFAIRSVFINDSNPFTKDKRKEFLAKLRPGEMILLDGADHLGKFVWKRLKSNALKFAGGLLITSHKQGLLPTLIECSTTHELFVELVSQLFQENCQIDQAVLFQVYNQHNGNIRDCLRHLYDIYGTNKEKHSNVISSNPHCLSIKFI